MNKELFESTPGNEEDEKRILRVVGDIDGSRKMRIQPSSWSTGPFYIVLSVLLSGIRNMPPRSRNKAVIEVIFYCRVYQAEFT